MFIISIPTSHTRCDYYVQNKIHKVGISIPTSHTRCDVEIGENLLDFVKFQSPHLIRDATFSGWDFDELYSISIPTSHTRCDIKLQQYMERFKHFNPHISYEMRRRFFYLPKCFTYFNPHISYEMRRVRSWRGCRDLSISIPTSHTRCDTSIARWSPITVSFQSPHLIRDATVKNN